MNKVIKCNLDTTAITLPLITICSNYVTVMYNSYVNYIIFSPMISLYFTSDIQCRGLPCNELHCLAISKTLSGCCDTGMVICVPV